MFRKKEQIEEDVQRIKKSKVFDEAWYLKTYIDVYHLKMNPIEHYVKYGKMMGRFQNASLLMEENTISGQVKPPAPSKPMEKIAVEKPAFVVSSCYQDHINISKRRAQGRALDASALRIRSMEIRKLFAWQATRKAGTLEQLMSAIEAFRDPIRKSYEQKVLRRLEPDWSLRLARIMAFQALLPYDRINALSLYRVFFEDGKAKFITKDHAKIFFDLALNAGEFKLAKQVLDQLPFNEIDAKFSRIDIRNPQSGSFTNPSKWLEDFNTVFVNQGNEPILLKEPRKLFGEFPVFDHLHCEVGEKIRSEHKISVVVSIWEPDQGLITSVESILNQSWENVEILLIDDCSDDAYQKIISYCIDLDPARVRYFRQAHNQGTYMARNLALQKATGEFITFQDADDWSHPRRLEKQVIPLLENSELMATSSRTVRARENLMFSYIGYANPERLNTSSLMFRLQEVKERNGFFDTVRKGADSEYLKRIEASFGAECYQPLKDVLSVVRLGEDSLSRADFRAGWRHPAREAYRGAYSYWHKSILSGEETPFRKNSDEERPFPAPTAFHLDRKNSSSLDPQHFDVVLVGDWRGWGGPQNSMLQEIEVFKAKGYSVAICHMEALRFMTHRMELLNERIQKLINEGVVAQVTLLDHVHTNFLLLRYPPILQFAPHYRSNINADSAVLVINQAPHELDGSDLRYEVHDCMRNARDIFGCDPIWIPQGPLVRDIASPLIPPQYLSQRNLPGFIETTAWATFREPLSNGRPILGKYSRDDLMKFPPSKEDLLACYPDESTFDVRIMGGQKACKKLLGTDIWPENWTMYDHGEKTARDFLDEIDFFVYFDNPSIVEAFGRSVLEAIASGRVTILPEKFKRVFGKGAVYCRPQDVSGVVTEFWRNPDKYRAQSKIAIECVKEEFSSKTFLETIRKLAPNLGVHTE